MTITQLQENDIHIQEYKNFIEITQLRGSTYGSGAVERVRIETVSIQSLIYSLQAKLDSDAIKQCMNDNQNSHGGC